MRSFLWLVVGLPIAVAIGTFAVINNHPVTIVLDPFSPSAPAASATLPTYALFFLSLMAGILIGGVATWFRQGRFRKAARAEHREALRWKSEAERLKASGETAGPALPAPGARHAA